jgi:hypothetical protein
MARDHELERWQDDWRAHDVIPAALARRVARGTRWMRLGVAVEIVITIAMGGGSLAWAIVSRRSDIGILAAGVWIIIAMAWTLSIVLRRGAWQPAAATTAAFVEIAILRCERGLQVIKAQAALFVFILGFDLVWLYHYGAETSVWTFLTRPAVVLIAWGGTVVAAAAAIWYRRRLRRELAQLLRLRRELEDV